MRSTSLLNGVPNVPKFPTCPRALRALRTHARYVPYVPYVSKYSLQTGKLKTLVLMESNEGSFADVFKGAEF